MRVKLHLYGEMKEKFGGVFEVEAKSPREAVTALMYQSQEYKDILREGEWHVMLDGDLDGGIDIGESQLDMELGRVKEIHLIPRIEGSNNGVFQFIVGAILVVVGAFTTWAGGGALIAAGVGMMVGGIIQMTTKIPGTKDLNKESADNKSSFLFNSPTNSSTQGVAIPRGYGRMLIGSQVISAALYSYAIENQTIPDPSGLPSW